MALNVAALRQNLAQRKDNTTPKPQRASATRSSPSRKAPGSQPQSPHSVEAEQGVLGSMLIDPANAIPEASRACQSWFFYVPAHRTTFDALCDRWDSQASVDLITFTQFLRDKGLLDQIGGASFVTHLFTFVPSSVMLQHYIGIVREKAMLREMIAMGTGLVRASYGSIEGSDEVIQLLEDYGRKMERIKYAAGGPNGSEPQAMAHLMSLNTHAGHHSLVGNNYLVRGGNSLWAGGAGYGKSSLTMQLAVYWATGTPVFGLRPSKKLKSLIVQAENDEFDMADQVQGVLKGIESLGDLNMDECRETVIHNVQIERVASKSGGAFLGLLDSLTAIARPDLLWVDPLFAYAGCDLMKADLTGRFLREGLFPIATKYGCCINVIHHIGKPHRDKGAVELSNTDKQYLGFGTSEIQNAFRAINSLLPYKDQDATAGRRVFTLTFSKRGIRAGAKSPDGSLTDHVFLEYSREGICWMQCDRPDESGAGSNATKYSTADILGNMSITQGWKTAELLKHIRGEIGMTSATFYRLWKDIKESGKIRVDEDGLWFRKGLSKSA